MKRLVATLLLLMPAAAHAAQEESRSSATLCAVPQRLPAAPTNEKKSLALLTSAARAYERGQFDVALRALQGAYQQNPLPLTLYNMAQACREAGRLRESLPLFERVLGSNPSPTLRQDAERFAQEVRKKLAAPDAARAAAHFGDQKYDDAIGAWQAAYAIDPQPSYLFQMAQSQRLAGRLAQALPLYQRFVTEAPRHERRVEADGHLHRIQAQDEAERAAGHQASQRFGQAIAAWEAAYKLDPQPLFLFQVAETERLAGLRQEALGNYERFLKDAPTHPRSGEAQGHVKQLRAEAEDREAVRLYKGRQYRSARAAWERAYAHVPDPPYLFQIGQAARLGGQPTDAERSYQRFLAADPQSIQAADAQGYIAAIKAERAAAYRRQHPPWYTRWWVWTLAGVVVAGAVTGAVIATRPEPIDPLEGVPPGNQVSLVGLTLRIGR